ncbi:MAG: acylphosphatase [Verrucomicrobiota bacterium]|nr:acylphosphatase [Verrucomicrobiota bacterium]
MVARLWLDFMVWWRVAGTRTQQSAGIKLRASGLVKKVRLRIFYTGRVQGVGFRYTAKHTALGFEVTGTVRNLSDGRVELVAEGSRDELEAFQQAIRESGLGHFIKHEEVAWEEAKCQFRGFEITS